MTDCPYINLKSDRYPTKKETEYEGKKERENRSVRPPPIPNPLFQISRVGHGGSLSQKQKKAKD